MSSEEPPSALTRLVPPITILALIVMIGSAALHVYQLSAKQAPPFSREAVPVRPDYTEASTWFLRPDEPPDGGWVSPWGVDVFWLSDTRSGYVSGWNAPYDWLSAGPALGKNHPFLVTLSSDHGVYVPKRRFQAGLNGSKIDFQAAADLELEDVFSAFDTYASLDHNLRGLFLGGTGRGVDLASDVYRDRIRASRPFDVLFGGVIASGKSVETLQSLFSDLPLCTESTQFPCILDISGQSADNAAIRIDKLMISFGDWLEANAAKPAEPLPPIEIIEIEPINKPFQN